MAALPDSHFSPLQDFELAWRWTDPRWAVVPPEVLAQIRSFTAQAAAGLGREATNLCRESVLRASSCIATDVVGEEEAVAAWLAALPISPSTWVIVSWHLGEHPNPAIDGHFKTGHHGVERLRR